MPGQAAQHHQGLQPHWEALYVATYGKQNVLTLKHTLILLIKMNNLFKRSAIHCVKTAV